MLMPDSPLHEFMNTYEDIEFHEKTESWQVIKNFYKGILLPMATVEQLVLI